MQLLRKTYGWLKVFFLFFLGKIRGIFVRSKFGIKGGYRHRSIVKHWDDTTHEDEYQKEVYELARFYLDRAGYTRVLDIGCGSGFKLLQFFSHCHTIGVEVSPTYEFLQQKYPGRTWVNVSQPELLPAQADVIICSDVIEHVKNPDELLQLIGKIDFEVLFLSTPERGMLRGWYDYGPPEHVCHIREWNAKEFQRYVADHFDVIAHQITHVGDATQLLICKKKNR